MIPTKLAKLVGFKIKAIKTILRKAYEQRMEVHSLWVYKAIIQRDEVNEQMR